MTETVTAPPLVIERSHLLQALAQTIPATAARGTSLPVLTGVRMQAEGERLRVTATDLETYVSCTIAARVAKGFDVIVNARRLQRIVKEAAGPLEFRLEEAPLASEQDKLLLSWGRTIASLSTMPVEEWPRPPAVEGATFTLGAADIDRVRRLSMFCSGDDARPILTGMYFSKGSIVGTDSYRLGIARLDVEFDHQFLLPSSVVRFLPPRMLDTETATVTVGERDCMIEVGEIRIRTVLIDGEFPPYEKLIPAGTPSQVTLSMPDLQAGVRVARAIVDDVTPVRLNIDTEAGKVHLVAIQQEVGSLASELDVVALEGHPPPATCAFNTKYFLDMLGILDEDTVTLHLTDSLKPVMVTEGAWTLLLMPVRVS